MESEDKKSGHVNSPRVRGYLDRAAECERHAARAVDFDAYRGAGRIYLVTAGWTLTYSGLAKPRSES